MANENKTVTIDLANGAKLVVENIEVNVFYESTTINQSKVVAIPLVDLSDKVQTELTAFIKKHYFKK